MRRSFARLALLVATLAGAGHAVAAPPAKPAAEAPKPTVATPPMFAAPEYVMGDPRAKVTVIEYASASCPHCARFDINVFPAFKAKYIDSGKVRYVFREFLTPPEQFAAAGFLLARCTGQAHYWSTVEDVFHAQEEIYKTGDVQKVFDRIGGQFGLSPAQIDACLENKPAVDALNARMDEAVDKQKIQGTPTFLINGKTAFSGEVDLARLSAAVDAALAGGGAKAKAVR
jgi:protein-disulfide isomerase